MDYKKSLIEDYYFVKRENPWNDKESFLNQNHLVGIFPIHKIPHIPSKKQLENYGIPAGFLQLNNVFIGGGEGEKGYNKNPPKLIGEELFNELFHLVSSGPKKQNKTKKIKKKA